MSDQIDLETVDLSTLEAVLETDRGEMVVGFYSEQAPNHVKNFLGLAQKGFYDGLAFHRIVRNFMIQGGCPNTREGESAPPGTGGPGHSVDAEFSDLPHKRGVLSMARSKDPNSAGSQFFVVHAEHADFLDREYTVFGHVTEGLDVLDAIASVEVEFGPGGEHSKPKERVGLRSVVARLAPVREEEPEAAAPEEGAPAPTDEQAGEGGGE